MVLHDFIIIIVNALDITDSYTYTYAAKEYDYMNAWNEALTYAQQQLLNFEKHYYIQCIINRI